MSKSNSFGQNLLRLTQILNIPLEEKWPLWTGRENYTLYRYWRNLGILSEEEIEGIHSHNGRLKPTNLLIQFFNRIDSHFPPKYYNLGKVADVGSGFGFITFWLILNGAKNVHTIGDSHRIAFIQKLYEQAVIKNFIDAEKIIFHPEFVKVGDLSLGKGIEQGSLSLVLLNDTLEHITPRIFPWLVRASYNNLKDGGYFISRQQNTDSPAMVRKLTSLWEEQEKEYILQRRAIIQNRIPNILDSDLDKLAKNTRGMDSVEFNDAIESYQSQNIFPPFKPELPPIDVEIDVPFEGDTSIKRITTEFKKNNFRKVFVYPDLLASRRSKYFQGLAKAQPKLFLRGHIFDQTTVFKIQK